MSLLTQEEIDKLSGAEELFPSPIPVQFVSSDEFMPSPQIAAAEEFEARVKDLGATLAQEARHDPPPVLQDGGRHGGRVRRDERGLRQAYAAGLRASEGRGVQPRAGAGARRRRSRTSSSWTCTRTSCATTRAIKTFVAQRETVGKAGWNPALAGKPQTIDDLKFANYFKEIFLDSDTKVACISGSYSVEPKRLVPHQRHEVTTRARRSTRKPARGACSRTPSSRRAGRAGWTRSTRRTSACKPDSWKGYTIGDNTNKHLSKFPFRLDDEKLMYPFYEQARESDGEVSRSPGPQERVHPQGPVPAVGGEAVPAPARLLQRRRRRQGGEGLAAAEFRHLPLGVPLGGRSRRHGRERVGPAPADRARRVGHRSRATFPRSSA